MITGNPEVSGDRRHLADLADVAPVDRDALDVEALRMREHRVLRARHRVLPDEHDAVVELLGQIVVRRRRLALDQLRGRLDFIDG